MAKVAIPPSCAALDLALVRRELIAAGANVTAAAKALGVPVTNLRLMTRALPVLIEAALEAEEQALDEAEAGLRAALQHPEASRRIAAAAHILKSSPAGRRRGW